MKAARAGGPADRVALRLYRDRSAVTAIEYAIIASLISIAIVVATRGIGSYLAAIFSSLGAQL